LYLPRSAIPPRSLRLAAPQGGHPDDVDMTEGSRGGAEHRGNYLAFVVFVS